VSTASSEQQQQRGKPPIAKPQLLPVELHLGDAWESVLNPSGPPGDALTPGLRPLPHFPFSAKGPGAGEKQIGVEEEKQG